MARKVSEGDDKGGGAGGLWEFEGDLWAGGWDA